MISIVCWLWHGTGLGDRPYVPAHVNALRASIARHLSRPHRFICVADSTDGFDPSVEVIITPPEAQAVGELRSPEGGRFPSCYRRLWNFSEGAKTFGDRILCIDIDLVPTADWAPLFDRTEEFVGWRPYRDWGRKLRFGGGIYLLTPGTRTHVWTQFNGEPAIRLARAAGFRGSDQAWISHLLGAREPYYGRDAGIYSIRDIADPRRLPTDARLVQFNGGIKPWSSALPWVREHWQGPNDGSQLMHAVRNPVRRPASADVRARSLVGRAGRRW